MTSPLQDLRFAFRTLAKAPVFTAVAAVSLALGIGANTAIFSLLDQLLLRMLPVKDPQQLVQISSKGPHYGNNSGVNVMSYPMYRDFRDRAQVFDGVVCRRGESGSLGYGGSVERVRVEMVSGNYFDVLGLKPLAGRLLHPDDDVHPGGHPLAVLSYGYWTARFAGDRSILGKPVIIDDLPFTVVGILGEGFTGLEVGDSSQVFVPVAMQERIYPEKDLLEDRRSRFLSVFARLKPGVSVEQAKAAVAPLYTQIVQGEVREKEFAKASRETRDAFLRSTMDVYPGGTGFSYMRMLMSSAMWILMALVGVVLMIACANVANLQLARAAARQKEMAVRLAIGASRWQIVRQLLIEGCVLASVAGLLGLVIGKISLAALFAAFIPPGTNLNIHASLDPRAMLFTVFVSLFVGILFGLAPALQSTKPELAGTLKDQAGSVVGGTHSLLRKTLAALQVTMSLLLVIGAALFVNSLLNLKALNPGFQPARLIVFSLSPASNGYDTARTQAFVRRLDEELQAAPGVESVSSGNVALVSGADWDSSLTIEGDDPSQTSKAWAYQNKILPDYFKTLGVPLKAGRDFNWADTATSKKVTIVNEQFVREYFPGKDPVGRHVGIGSDPGTKVDIEVVGVVADFKYQNMDEKIGRQMFEPYMQMKYPFNVSFYVRSPLDPQTMFRTVREAVRKLDPNLPVFDIRSMDEQIAQNLVVQRLVASLAAVFGALATLLAMIGLYGVMAYLVGRRSREIGIRMALGATQGDVIRAILREVGFLVGIGLAAGLALAFALTGFVKSLLFGVTPNDPLVLAGAFLGLAVVAMFSGWLPAFRAAQTDPSRALRYE
jgi:predicted permease